MWSVATVFFIQDRDFKDVETMQTVPVSTLGVPVI